MLIILKFHNFAGLCAKFAELWFYFCGDMDVVGENDERIQTYTDK